MQIKKIINLLQQWVPEAYAENFDNVGLILGDAQEQTKGILICLDTTEQVIEEAVEKECKLIISFHPVIFNPLKTINTSSSTARIVKKVLENNLSVYVIHTNLDNVLGGIYEILSKELGLKNTGVLFPKSNQIKKLITYVPKKNANSLKNILSEVGVTEIKEYENKTYNLELTEALKANREIGDLVEKKILNSQEETTIHFLFPFHKESVIKKALIENHPYQHVPYEITYLDNKLESIGLGRLGELSQDMKEENFLGLLSEKLKLRCIRHSVFLGKGINKVAFMGGSGAFSIDMAIEKEADVLISSDFKYHDFRKASQKILLLDIGHYESEISTRNLIKEYLESKLPNFAIFESEKEKNPINYFF